MTPTLFQRLLGAGFYHLAPELKAMHSRRGVRQSKGVCTVERGRGVLARLACSVLGLPRSMRDAPFHVDVDAQPDSETWQRSFGGAPMRSRLRVDAGLLQDKTGPLRLRLRLLRIDKELHWVAEQGRVFSVFALPGRWLDGIRYREFATEGRYHVELDVRLPVFGTLLRYSGWLETGDHDDSPRRTT